MATPKPLYPAELYALYALFPTDVPVPPFPELPEVERQRWTFLASAIDTRVCSAWRDGYEDAKRGMVNYALRVACGQCHKLLAQCGCVR